MSGFELTLRQRRNYEAVKPKRPVRHRRAKSVARPTSERAASFAPPGALTFQQMQDAFGALLNQGGTANQIITTPTTFERLYELRIGTTTGGGTSNLTHSVSNVLI